MKLLESVHNPIYKNLLLLKNKPQERIDSGSMLIEGIHLCEAWVRAGIVPITWITAPQSKNNPFIEQLLQQYPAPQLQLSALRMQELSEHPHPVGVMAQVPRPVPQQRLSRHAVILERIQDPGNLGTLLRTSAAAGTTQIFLLPGCTDPFSLRCLRAGMGAQLHLDIHPLESSEEIEQEPWQPRQLLVTTLDSSTSLYTADLSQAAAWIFGNEGQGVSAFWKTKATQRIHIPISLNIESLNVATAAAVCLFEQQRQDILPQVVPDLRTIKAKSTTP